MSQNANYFTEGRALHYLLMPGDGTAYRFSILPFHELTYAAPVQKDQLEAQDCVSNYIMDAGVNAAGEGFVKLAIDMPVSVGFGTVPIGMLSGDYLGIDYLKTHGFGEVDTYTLVAVLLAVKVLAAGYQIPETLTEAATAMLEAPHYMHLRSRAQEDHFFEDSNDAGEFLDNDRVEVEEQFPDPEEGDR